MKLKKISDLFNIYYGVNLELNSLTLDSEGLNFVSRTAKNNGVSAKVQKIADVKPIQAGTISVAGGGSVLESFLQTKPYYSGRDLYYLVAKEEMSDQQKLFYCACLRANKYRYNYGRQANRTLKDILVPALDEIPKWVTAADLDCFKTANKPLVKQTVPKLDIGSWKMFTYESLFTIVRGQGPRIKELTGAGATSFITSIDSNNGLTSFTEMSPCHEGNVITVNRNGSVGEAFYQAEPFCSTEDVHVFNPKFKLDKYIAMFLIALIRKEKYRFNYGRKWGIDRMKKSTIYLPVTTDGKPDWNEMRRYIQTLQFSKSI